MNFSSLLHTTLTYLAISDTLKRYGGSMSLICLVGLFYGIGREQLAYTIASITCFIGLILGLGQHIFALRVRFDREVFSHWLANLKDAHEQQAILHGALVDFDHDLMALGLGHPPVPTRDLLERCQGACRLLKKQRLYFILQASFLMIAYVIIIGHTLMNVL